MEFQDTMPLAPPVAHPAVAERRAEPPPRTLSVEFTGSGSEYFRIWIVNLLLTIVTLSLYHPFAKARRLRYFHGNTLIGGHALGFHGDPWKMLRGYLLMLVFGACYFGAGQFSPVTGAVAGIGFAVLWPALWQSSLRFRLANTSWRGLRMRFGGDLPGAYSALLPLLIPGALLLVGTALQPRGPKGQPGEPGWLAGLAGIAMAVLLPYALAQLKRYQHGHYEYAGEQTRLDVRTRSFYGVMLKTMLIGAAPLAVIGGLVALILPSSRGGAATVGLLALLPAAYVLLLVLMQSYPASRLQNLVWGGTSSVRLHFSSELRFGSLLGRQLVNLIMTICTIGLYRPFAAIALAKLRLEAVSIEARGDIDLWTSAAARNMQDASGDAAGDLFGIDIGW